MRSVMLVILCVAAAETFAQFKNIKLAEEAEGGPAPVNSGIMINHKDPKNIVAAISLNKAVYTKDGGLTWSESLLKSSSFSGGNPVLVSDQKGNAFYFHESDGKGKGSEQWLDRIVLQKSEDGGKTWDDEAFFGLNPPKDLTHFTPAIHPRKVILYTAWTQFDEFQSAEANCQSNVLFSMSMNGGGKWTKPLQLNQAPGDCRNDNNSIADAVTTVGLDGKIFASWVNQGTIFFDRSYDGGETWLSNDLAIGKIAGGWSMNIPGFGRSDSRPKMVVDISLTRAQGSLYMTYADQKNGADDTDVWFVRSVNRGDNWTVPKRLNTDEPGKHQFSPAIAVDQTTGNIYIAYYDQRGYDDGRTNVYLSYSSDGGNVFYETRISEIPFVPTEGKSVGTIGIAAEGGFIAPVWSRIDNGKVSVWTAVIKSTDLPRDKKPD